MTPKEKAKELLDMFTNLRGKESWTDFTDEVHAKQCALIAVDMVIEQFVGVYDSLKFADQLTGNVEDSANYKFWQEVKEEITNL